MEHNTILEHPPWAIAVCRTSPLQHTVEMVHFELPSIDNCLDKKRTHSSMPFQWIWLITKRLSTQFITYSIMWIWHFGYYSFPDISSLVVLADGDIQSANTLAQSPFDTFGTTPPARNAKTQTENSAHCYRNVTFKCWFRTMGFAEMGDASK